MRILTELPDDLGVTDNTWVLDASRRTMRQTYSVATAAATASAVRWREREGPRLAFFHVLLSHALAQGELRHLLALWRRIPAAYPLPAVVATLRAPGTLLPISKRTA